MINEEIRKKLNDVWHILDKTERMCVSIKDMGFRDFDTWRAAFFECVERMMIDGRNDLYKVIEAIDEEEAEKGGDA